MMSKRSYSELKNLSTFQERFEYLRLNTKVGVATFGYERYLNQAFYTSTEWKQIRNKVILRDNGCDLGIPGREIHGKIYIHHINPLTVEDITEASPGMLDLNNLICTSYETHNAIHYGSSDSVVQDPIERVPNDTCLWRK